VNWFLTLIRNDCWLQICCGIGTYEKNFGLTFHLTNNKKFRSVTYNRDDTAINDTGRDMSPMCIV